MPERLTIFYSWQSDTPSNLNRSFIEKALHQALKRLRSEADLVEALRDSEIGVDQGTRGVPGSPPIAATILRKIEECAAFVADLTFVGTSIPAMIQPGKQPRAFPNPNVMLEYGYALKCHSHEKMVGIMNTAYGKPTTESLPFDLRHLLWPITYCVPSASDPNKSKAFTELVDELARALALILVNRPQAEAESEKFVPHPATTSPALFFEDVADLFSGTRFYSGPSPNKISGGAKAYLRLYPRVKVPAIEGEFQATELARQGHLQPMGRFSNYNCERNIFGCLVYEYSGDQVLSFFTQLFLNCELWGVDAAILDENNQREVGSMLHKTPYTKYIPVTYIEEHFVTALRNYLAFAKNYLRLGPALYVEAGLTGIKDYTLSVATGLLSAYAIRDHIKWEGEASCETPAWDILRKFFDRVWENCGTQRTAAHADRFAKEMQQTWAKPNV